MIGFFGFAVRNPIALCLAQRIRLCTAGCLLLTGTTRGGSPRLSLNANKSCKQEC